MTKFQYAFIPLALAAAACSPPASETTQPEGAASSVPADIAAQASAAAPGITITGGELGNNQYEVSGTLPNGDEIEIDLVQSNGAWTVLEIQRDIAWSTVPEPVRAEAAAGQQNRHASMIDWDSRQGNPWRVRSPGNEPTLRLRRRPIRPRAP